MVGTEASCFNAVNRLMPLLRAESARRLLQAGLRQERVAEHLGVSQAMVSKYTRARPAPEILAPPALLKALVEATVKAALDDEAAGRVSAWCRACLTLTDAGLAVRTKPWPGLAECARGDQGPSLTEASAVLAALAEAETRIRRLPFARLLPQVRSNLAMALPAARSSRDVAAFPGRFIELRGQVRAAAPAEFGASSHLAGLLLRIRRSHPEVRAILNLRNDDASRRAARAAGLRLRSLRRIRGELAITAPRDERIDALLDPGAFGIEPTLYLVAEEPNALVAKVERILPHLAKE